MLLRQGHRFFLQAPLYAWGCRGASSWAPFSDAGKIEVIRIPATNMRGQRKRQARGQKEGQARGPAPTDLVISLHDSAGGSESVDDRISWHGADAGHLRGITSHTQCQQLAVVEDGDGVFFFPDFFVQGFLDVIQMHEACDA